MADDFTRGRALSSPLLDQPIKGLIYKVVLTGGPCGGKTTSCTRLRTFFENLGWKVYVVPETATVLLGGGVTFSELSTKQADSFQCSLLKTMMQIESVYSVLAQEEEEKNVLIVYDRGTMDPSAFCERSVWLGFLDSLGVTEIDFRDKRYDQVVHLETAASGAQKFYTLASNNTRTETVEEAIFRDNAAAKAWLGHPYYDFIDNANSSDFDQKIRRVIEAVCTRLSRKCGVVLQTERLSAESKKRKFLVTQMPSFDSFPAFSDFDVCHIYLKSSNPSIQMRIRKRGNGNSNMFTYTVVKAVGKEVAEARKQISHREYEMFLAQRDLSRATIFKKRYCFVWTGNYFQLDVYTDENSDRCRGLMLLETYTTQVAKDLVLPDFLTISSEITGNKTYSMFNLALAAPSASPSPPQPSQPPPPSASNCT